MLEISVESNGNTGGRYFPCSGYFGITPVVVSGKVTTRVPPFAQPLPVKAVYAVVRCVESRGSVERVLWEKAKPIWSSSEYTILGDWSHPFRISISPEAAKVATSSLDLKEWKAVWKFDIAIEHEPIPFVGHRIIKRFLLDLRNYSTPRTIDPPAIDARLGSGTAAADVKVTPPTGVLGPEDSINVAIQATPLDPSVVARKATLVLERVLEFLEDGKSEVTSIASSSADMTRQDGVYRCCLAVKLPKRTARWDVGETSTTSLIAMKFQLRATITVKGKSSCELHTEPMPVQVCNVSAAQRSLASAAAPIKIRKHRSARRGLYMHEGTVEISEGILAEPSSPTYYTSPLPNTKPILLSPHRPPAQAQSISFVFPSPPPHASYLSPLPSLAEPADDSWTLHKRFQHTGRRISTTASEEEAMQPSRSRLRVSDLPSLDALGLGLPPVPRRPVTAPAQYSAEKAQFAARPTSAAAPLSEAPRPRTTGGEDDAVLSPHTFAFTVKDD